MIGRIKERLWRYPFLRRLYMNGLSLRQAVREGLWNRIVRVCGGPRDRILRQRPLVWRLPIPRLATWKELHAWLEERGIPVLQGKHALYLPPGPRLTEVFPSVSSFYPPPTGFKVLKDLRPPEEASYLGASQPFVRVAVGGTTQELATVANYLHACDLGPRVWDVSEWRGEGTRLSVFAMEHVDGEPPTEDECRGFRDELRRRFGEGLLKILVLDWERCCDFQAPDCNRNLLMLRGSRRPRYVDFQNFALSSDAEWGRRIVEGGVGALHFGGGRMLRGDRYLYQSLPTLDRAAKRDTLRRWTFLRAKLNESGNGLADRLVLDIGCNAGMMLHCALTEGAAWGLGWDRPEVAPLAHDMLLSLGDTRFTIRGRELSSKTPIEEDVPATLRHRLDGCAIFYLSIRKHVGMMESLKRIPWRILVYEGHQWETLEELPSVLELLTSLGARVLCTSRLADGDCAPRPLAILVRSV